MHHGRAATLPVYLQSGEGHGADRFRKVLAPGSRGQILPGALDGPPGHAFLLRFGFLLRVGVLQRTAGGLQELVQGAFVPVPAPLQTGCFVKEGCSGGRVGIDAPAVEQEAGVEAHGLGTVRAACLLQQVKGSGEAFGIVRHGKAQLHELG